MFSIFYFVYDINITKTIIYNIIYPQNVRRNSKLFKCHTTKLIFYTFRHLKPTIFTFNHIMFHLQQLELFSQTASTKNRRRACIELLCCCFSAKRTITQITYQNNVNRWLIIFATCLIIPFRKNCAATTLYEYEGSLMLLKTHLHSVCSFRLFLGEI
jgi:hypothetical protein